MKKNILEKSQGITIVALVITIIVLLILAGVTINLTIGENDIIKSAQDSKIKYEIAQIKEQIGVDILAKQVQNNGNIQESSLIEILEKYGTLSEAENIRDKILTTTGEKYEIKVSDIFSGTIVEDVQKEPTFTTVANKPDIRGFDKSKTYYVSWNINAEETEYIPSEKKMSENVAPDNWYDYTAGKNEWANVKTTGGGNDCYWVWVPRYAYQVPTKGGTAQTINIKFLQDNTNIPIGETEAITNTTPSAGSWVVHPAFWFDKNNDGVENNGEQLTGIWVAKYEASSSNVNTINLENGTLTGDTNSLKGNGGGQNTNLQVRVKPNVTSWRGINANGMFEVCQNLTKTVNGQDNSLVCSTNLDSHMMKNTEWGAVAYLSRSIYGKNDEVWINPYNYSTSNYSSITGVCSNEADGKNKSTTDITKTYRYNEVGGGNASTTGNVYGVYDMAGGAWEDVAGIYKSGSSNENRSKLWEPNNLKYVDQYTKNTGSQSTYYGNTNKYGDAVYETSSSGGDSDTSSWETSFSTFPSSVGAMFTRGGRAGAGSKAGVFAFYSRVGDANDNNSFRPVVLNL